MSNKKTVTFVGWIRKGKPANCGETMKNQLLIARLEELGVRVRQMDFKDWRKHPWVLLQLLWNMIINKKDTLILSTSAQNVYPLMKLMKKLKWQQNTVHWVIGGSLGEKVISNVYRKDIIGYISHTLVESPLMKEQLDSCGIKGVKVVPNFKPINYIPNINEKEKVENRPLHFIFLSRIMPEKGCDYILEAVKLLNNNGYKHRFLVDFFGKIDEQYLKVFQSKIDVLQNVKYQGFLNLRQDKGYDMLATYDVMLFPTYWRGEGLAGVFIDTFISGVPMIVTDWAHNRCFMEDGRTALFIPVHNVVALYEKMKNCIDGKYDLFRMATDCQKQAEKFNIEKVVTNKLLAEILQ